MKELRNFLLFSQSKLISCDMILYAAMGGDKYKRCFARKKRVQFFLYIVIPSSDYPPSKYDPKHFIKYFFLQSLLVWLCIFTSYATVYPMEFDQAPNFCYRNDRAGRWGLVYDTLHINPFFSSLHIWLLNVLQCVNFKVSAWLKCWQSRCVLGSKFEKEQMMNFLIVKKIQFQKVLGSVRENPG